MTESVFAPRYRAMSVGVLMSVTIVAFQSLGVGTVMPAVARDLGGLEHYGWAFSAFMLASLVGSVAAGQDADRAGPVRAYLAAVGSFAAGSVLAAVAPVVGRAARGPRARGARRRRARRRHLRVGEPRLPAGDVRAHARADVVGVGAPLARRAGGRRAGRRPHDAGAGCSCCCCRSCRSPSCSRCRGCARSRGRRRGARRAAAAAAGARARGGHRGCSSPRWSSSRPLLLVAAAPPGSRSRCPALRALLPAGTLRAARGLPSGIVVRGLLAVAFLGCDAFMPLALTELRGFSVVAGRAGDQRGVAELEPRLVPAGAPRPPRRRRRAPAPAARRARGAARRDRASTAAGRARATRSRSRSRSRGWAIAGLRHRDRLPVDRRDRALGRRRAARRARLGGAAALETIGVAVFTGIGGALIAVGLDEGWDAVTALALVFARGRRSRGWRRGLGGVAPAAWLPRPANVNGGIEGGSDAAATVGERRD